MNRESGKPATALLTSPQAAAEGKWEDFDQNFNEKISEDEKVE